MLLRCIAWIWRRIGDVFTVRDVLDFFDLKTALSSVVGGLISMIVAATNYGWSPQAVFFAALFGAACVAIVFVAIRIAIASFRHPTDGAAGVQRQNVSAQAQTRIQLTEFRELARKAGWCTDVNSIPIGGADWWGFCVRLRQVASEGVVQFWGRKNLHGWMSQDIDDTPRTKIPPEHFEEFGFDCTQFAQCQNYDIVTTKIGEPTSSFVGRNYRDLEVDAAQARTWLADSGKPPNRADMTIVAQAYGAKIGDYTPISALLVSNIGDKDLEKCIIQMEQFSGTIPSTMPMPLVLRTDGQIRGERSGRFMLSKGQPKTVPILFVGPTRKDEWYFIDEHGKKYFVPAGPAKMVIGVYGGVESVKALVNVDVDAGWEAYPSVKTVPMDFKLDFGADTKKGRRLSCTQ
jgi:hypothetical protein